MQDKILRDNFINYKKLPVGAAIPPSVREDMDVYGCKEATIELPIKDMMEYLRKSPSRYNIKPNDELSKADIIKYTMNFYTGFFGKDLDLTIREESTFGSVKDEKTGRTIKGVSQKHLGKFTPKFGLSDEHFAGKAVQSLKSSKENGYITKEVSIGGKTPTFMSIGVLAHEYAHMLAFKTQKSIENYSNVETIPILMEQLVYYDAIMNEKDIRKSAKLQNAARLIHINRYGDALKAMQKSVAFIDTKNERLSTVLDVEKRYGRDDRYIVQLDETKAKLLDGQEIMGENARINELVSANALYREKYIVRPFMDLDRKELEKANVSTVYTHGIGAFRAYGLFEKFVDMEPYEQSQFKHYLCDVLNGKATIEQMLSDYEVTMDRGLIDRYTNVTERYIKEYSEKQSIR